MRKPLIISCLAVSLYHSAAFAEVQTSTTTTSTTPVEPTAIIQNNGTIVTKPSGGTTTTTTTVITDTTTPTAVDEKIISEVYTNYAQSPALLGTALTVSSQNGVVTIEGTVTAQSQADAAIEQAQSVPGVKDVRSKIIVTTNPNLGNPKPLPNY